MGEIHGDQYLQSERIISVPKPSLSVETELLRNIEWVRNRRKELETAIYYEKRKNKLLGDVEESNNDVPCDFDIVQPKLADTINKAAMSASMMKKLQFSHILEKIVTSSLEVGASQNGEKIVADIQTRFGDLLQHNIDEAKKMIEKYEAISLLRKENIEKQLRLSKMAHERHILMQKHWKKKEQEDMAKEDMASERIKGLEKKIEEATRMLTVNNHVLQLITAYSGVKWSEDPELLSTLIECGKPIDEQLAG